MAATTAHGPRHADGSTPQQLMSPAAPGALVTGAVVGFALGAFLGLVLVGDRLGLPVLLALVLAGAGAVLAHARTTRTTTTGRTARTGHIGPARHDRSHDDADAARWERRVEAHRAMAELERQA